VVIGDHDVQGNQWCSPRSREPGQKLVPMLGRAEGLSLLDLRADSRVAARGRVPERVNEHAERTRFIAIGISQKTSFRPAGARAVTSYPRLYNTETGV